jgi:hypothetical protein
MRRAVLAASAVALLVLLSTAPARANAPLKDGWWSETNAGLGFSAVPAQVVAGGLYVENGFNGPVAVSALSFGVPSGATVGQMTLAVTGNPVITSPPVACALTPAGEAFKAADGGPWSDAPAYDCSQGQVTGNVSSDMSSVSFAVGPLLHQGIIAVAVKAGGPADQIAFAPPGAGTLAVTPAGSASAAPPLGSPPAAVAPAAVSGGPAAPAASVPAGSEVPAAPSSPIPSPAAASASDPSLATATPGTGLPGTGSTSLAQPSSTRLETTSSVFRHASGAGKAGEILGAIGLVGLLVAYTEGYGLLGGRIRHLARLQPSRNRPAYPDK